jgi:hypothetical protein
MINRYILIFGGFQDLYIHGQELRRLLVVFVEIKNDFSVKKA